MMSEMIFVMSLAIAFVFYTMMRDILTEKAMRDKMNDNTYCKYIKWNAGLWVVGIVILFITYAVLG